MLLTGRSEEHVNTFRNYYRAQGLYGMPRKGDIDYTKVLDLDLSTVAASVAGPKRPQDRIAITELKSTFHDILCAPPPAGYGKDRNSCERVAARAVVGVGSEMRGSELTGGGAQEAATSVNA